MRGIKWVLVLALLLVLPNRVRTQPVKAAAPAPAFRVLVFFGTAGFFHNSIYYVNKVWSSLGEANGFAVDTARDPKVFNPDSLKKYQVVVFNNVTHAGDLLNADQKAAWWTWSKTHGYLGMHAAADTYGTWPEYSQWMGGELSVHSGTDSGTMNLDTTDFARNHPIVKDQALPAQVRFREEWYSFKVNPRTYPGMHVLYTLDEKTFKPGVVMGDHPIVWVKELPEGGRMVYMGMGHEDNVFKPELDLGYGFVSKIMLSSL